MRFVYMPDKMEPVYRGKDIGIGSGTYVVRQEGSRYIIEVPETIGGLATEHHLKCHGWVKEGEASAIAVERAVRDARALEARKLSDDYLHNQEALHAELRKLANEYGLIDHGIMWHAMDFEMPYVDHDGNVVNAREAFEKWRQMEPQEFRRRSMQQSPLLSQSERPSPSSAPSERTQQASSQSERSQPSPSQERRNARPSE